MATRFIKLPPTEDEEDFEPTQPSNKPTIQKSAFAVTRHNVFKVNKGKLNRFGNKNDGLEQINLNDGMGGKLCYIINLIFISSSIFSKLFFKGH